MAGHVLATLGRRAWAVTSSNAVSFRRWSISAPSLLIRD